MKVIAKTDEYTIYQKRSERYAVQNTAREWINGDDKVAILLEHKLIEAAAPKAPEPEVEEAAVEDAATDAGGEEASEAAADTTEDTGSEGAADEAADEEKAEG